MNRNRSRARAASILLVVAVLAFAAAPRPALAAETLNRVVLRVNDQIATLYDYRQREQDVLADINRREQDPVERRRQLEQAPPQVFKDMYDELLLQSRADQLSVQVTEEQVDRAVAQMKQAYSLKTDDELRAALAQSGLTEAKLREQYRINLRIRDVLGQEVNSKVRLEEDDLRRYYRKHVDDFREPEKVQLKEVVVLEEGVPDAAERSRIAAAITRAVAGGQALDEATKTYHESNQVSDVIDLGWVAPGDLDPTLEKAAWRLERGAMSEPVPGRGGVHLLQMVDRSPSHIKAFNEVSAEIQAKEEERLYREKVIDYMAQLRKESLVVAQPPEEAVGYERLLGTGGRTTDEFNVGRATPAPAGATPGATAAPGAPTAQPPAPSPAVEATAAGDESTAAQPAPVVPEVDAPGSPGALPEPKPVTPAEPPAVPPPARR